MQALSSLSVDTQGAGGRADMGLDYCLLKLTGFSMAQPIFDRVGLHSTSILPPPYWCTDFAAPELLRSTAANQSHDEVDSESAPGVGFAADVWSVGVLTFLL